MDLPERCARKNDARLYVRIASGIFRLSSATREAGRTVGEPGLMTTIAMKLKRAFVHQLCKAIAANDSYSHKCFGPQRFPLLPRVCDSAKHRNMPRQLSTRRNAILFFSTGDATRSQMAEGFFRAWSQSTFESISTAVRPTEINPHAAAIMQEMNIDITGQRSRTIKDSFKRHFVCVVAICEVPRERCPIWPFTRRLLTWNIHDPGKPTDGESDQDSLRETRDEIAAHVKEFIAQTVPDLHLTKISA